LNSDPKIRQLCGDWNKSKWRAFSNNFWDSRFSSTKILCFVLIFNNFIIFLCQEYRSSDGGQFRRSFAAFATNRRNRGNWWIHRLNNKSIVTVLERINLWFSLFLVWTCPGFNASENSSILLVRQFRPIQNCDSMNI
jgi:hypothetical protein